MMRISHLFYGCLLITCLGFTTARAAEDGEGSIFGTIIGTITGADQSSPQSAPIDYHERPGLVLPPPNQLENLPPPRPRTQKQANWPQDPDALAAQKAQAAAKTPRIPTDPSEKLSKEELMKGQIAANGHPMAGVDCSNTPSRGCGNPSEIWEPLKVKKQGTSQEAVLRPGYEPTRQYLTQPPKGYLTPQKEATYTFDAPQAGMENDRGEQASDYYRQQAQH